MNFAHPLAWLLLLLLIPVVLLYRLRVRVPTQTVGTGLFWEKALAEEKFRSRWRRWRTKVSLALQMLIVALITVAAAGPQIPASQRIMLIIDNSATMRATDVQPTRLDAAKEVAHRLIVGLQSYDEVAVVTVGPSPTEVQPLTNDHSMAIEAVDSVQPSADPAAIDWAVKLAREISAPDKVPTHIVLITDACAKEATRQAEQSGVEVLRVGTAAGNLGITRFTARRSRAEPATCEVLVEVSNQGNQTAQGSVSIAVDEKPESLPSPGGRTRPVGRGGVPGTPGRGEGSSFSIAKDDRWQHVFILDLPKVARLNAKIEPGDAYNFDDSATLEVSAAPVRLDGQSPWKDEIFSGIVGWDQRASASAGPPTRAVGGPALAGGELVPPYDVYAADIRVPNDIGSEAPNFAIENSRSPLWIFPAALAAALMVIEWCLFQRRWTC